ncbi:hypothetical protein Leryth_005327 [Lithospermum erythrorhizon]|nr:hypothetical protein Leryth_005327 [Lithospermum erythrorhizon]
MEVYTVAEIDNMLESGDYWVEGFFQLSEEYQKLFYMLDVTTVIRKCIIIFGIIGECQCLPLVVLSVSEHTSTAKSIAMGDVAETILQNSISNIVKLTKLGLDYDLQSIRSELDVKRSSHVLRHSPMQ